jgi:large subunit ribosomal protein L9
MEVILLQKIANLGDIGDRVKVKPGFGRNYLLPGGKATLATAENIARFESRRAELEAKAAADLTSARARAAALEGFKLGITAKAGSEGKLFGSIGTADIAEACQKAGHAIERAEVRLPGGPIRSTGEHLISLHLHSDVDVQVPLTVVAEEAAASG